MDWVDYMFVLIEICSLGGRLTESSLTSGIAFVNEFDSIGNILFCL